MASSSNMKNSETRKEAKIVVGVDFGTTFSGFAYALRADPDRIYTFYDWPMQAESGVLPYCKTQTSLLYIADASNAAADPFALRDWGWPAFVKYKSRSAADSSRLKAIRSSSGIGYFLTSFKLQLARKEASTLIAMSGTPPRPLVPGMTVKRAITDFLSQLSKFILRELRSKFGTLVTVDDVQWCLAVPATWDEQAKQELRHCTELAGLTRRPYSKFAGSLHQLKLFIEPEAASTYCQLKVKDHLWNKGDKFLVVDCGGGTVDLVLHEKLGPAPTISVREVQESSDAVCGGLHVDDEFFHFLRRKISCFQRFEREHPATALDFRQRWERVKFEFNGAGNDAIHIHLPPKLATMWEREEGFRNPLASNVITYDELEITIDDMRSIFDPVVNKILQLVEARIVSDLQAIVMVGGFSASPYLMRRIKNNFGDRVPSIISPPYPGSSVCCGAVTMGIRSDTTVSRISKRTYGLATMTPFEDGVHPDDFEFKIHRKSKSYCKNVFVKFVTEGEAICIDDCVKKSFALPTIKQASVDFEIYSSGSQNPKYVTDLDMKKEGTLGIQCPSFYDLGFWPCVEFSMLFGRTEIQVTARGTNFVNHKNEMLTVKFETESIY